MLNKRLNIFFFFPLERTLNHRVARGIKNPTWNSYKLHYNQQKNIVCKLRAVRAPTISSRVTLE